MIDNSKFLIDELYGERLLISIQADQTELNDNIRVARVLLSRKSEDITLWAMSSYGSQKGPA